jgi:acetyltransferase-like isoleucine patch superfamily enzyme
VKALAEIGWRKALRFGWFTLAMVPYRLALVPQLRAPWLRLLGASIGRRSVLHDVRFFNLYRRGLAGLVIADECFVGDECLFDLAEGITIEDQVTLAERVLVLTHTNVGYHDHPLQAHFPARQAPVVMERGCFVGAAVTVLPGVRIGREAFVAAGSVVTRDVPPRTVVAGVPARPLRELDP